MTRALHWFRNDLRLRDNTALSAAAAAADELACVFVLDERLLRARGASAPRLRFLLACLESLAEDLRARGVPLFVRRGDPTGELRRLLEEHRFDVLSFNRDTTPYARRRDAAVLAAVGRASVRVIERKDRVVFEAGEVRKGDGGAYTVYTPYARAWYRRLAEDPQPPQRAPRLPGFGRRVAPEPVPTARELGLGGDATRLPPAGEGAARGRLRRFLADRVEHYPRDRDRPAVDGTSRLSPHLRFGTLSVRDCVAAACEASAAEPRCAAGVRKWVDELVWREFYAAILEENPRVSRGAWRREYAGVRWDDDPELFAAWCGGRTGFPFVDAAMRQLRETGWMHNRARMVAASFLVKDLLIDWRRGESWFLERLIDGDPASNNGGWQWSASTGTDAAPYFRIFNPVTQGERHDPEGEYVRRWVPELGGLSGRAIHRPWESPVLASDYPARVVVHEDRREEALERFREAKERSA